MVYLMAKTEHMNYPYYKKEGFQVFAGELFTEREASKYSLDRSRFIKVNIKKTDTYFCFGVRRFFKGSHIEVLGEN